MKKRSKRYKNIIKTILNTSTDTEYQIKDALQYIYKIPNTKFNETIELSLSLKKDKNKKQNILLNEVINLPHGNGKKSKIIIFTEDTTGLDNLSIEFAGLDDLITKIENNSIKFDIALSTPFALTKITKLAKILGPKGLMPSKKTETVIPKEELLTVVKKIEQGRVHIKEDKKGNIGIGVGKKTFNIEKIENNINHVLSFIKNKKDLTLKENHIKSIYISLSMSPSLKINKNTI